LAEVLRCGHGMEEQTDYHEYTCLFQIRDAEQVFRIINEWQQARRLIGIQVNEQQGILTGVIVDAQPTLTVGPGIASAARLLAYLLVGGGMLRLWSPIKEAVDRLRADVRLQAGPGLSDPQERVDRVIFTDVVAEALIFPLGQMDQAEFERRIQEQAARHFEETWIHRPLRSLNLIPPIDAAGHGVLRKKLLGVMQFLQDCAAITLLGSYDFNRLRRKLGLMQPAAPGTAAAGPADFGAMGPAELAAFPVDQLSDAQLEQAFQAAVKLDMQDLASHFARAVVARPSRAEQSDRFPWYAHLVQRALAEGDTDEALNLVNEGEKADCEQNEGRRRNDYELRRGQVHTRRGEADQAYDVYSRLIERVPAELRYRGSAAEAMLSLKQGTRALQFAEDGLKNARAQNNRDSEQHFLELVAAAKKQVG
jgi:tetratricopeptide (TPR) repeat protein